jgi:hypothetical protein
VAATYEQRERTDRQQQVRERIERPGGGAVRSQEAVPVCVLMARTQRRPANLQGGDHHGDRHVGRPDFAQHRSKNAGSEVHAPTIALRSRKVVAWEATAHLLQRE